MTERVGRLLGLMIVTAVALTVAITVTAGSWGRSAPNGDGETKSVIPKTPVSVMEVAREEIEITDTYSGMIRPWERFSLGFEVAGRVVALGTNAEGEPLDDGDLISAGQELARLDDRVARSRLEEGQAQLDAARAQVRDAKAKLEKAQSDMRRSEQLRQVGGPESSQAITEKQYRADVAQLSVAEAQAALAEAQLTMAEARLPTLKKNVDDTSLLSPVSGVISRRLVNVGESVNPHQVIMEIIQVDEVLLVVGVPEAFVNEIQVGQPVHVELLARDRFRRERQRADGRVHLVAEAADRTTGLFEVEILLPNPQQRWKPGHIALAHIVIDRVQGYRIPTTCAVFREQGGYLFSVEKEGRAVHQVGESGTARRVELTDWIEQGNDLILSDLPPERRAVVKRGQHRLVDGREVRLVRPDDGGQTEAESPPPIRPATRVAGAKS